MLDQIDLNNTKLKGWATGGQITFYVQKMEVLSKEEVQAKQ